MTVKERSRKDERIDEVRKKEKEMKERIGKDNYGDNDRQNLRLLRAKNALAKTAVRHCEEPFDFAQGKLRDEAIPGTRLPRSLRSLAMTSVLTNTKKGKRDERENRKRQLWR
jgi:hypothetical protein